MTPPPAQKQPLPLDPATLAALLRTTIDAVAAPLPAPRRRKQATQREAAFIVIATLRPRDPLEAMLAARIVVAHVHLMDNLRCAAQPDLPPNLRLRFRASALALTRLMDATMRELTRRQAGPALQPAEIAGDGARPPRAAGARGRPDGPAARAGAPGHATRAAPSRRAGPRPAAAPRPATGASPPGRCHARAAAGGGRRPRRGLRHGARRIIGRQDPMPSEQPHPPHRPVAQRQPARQPQPRPALWREDPRLLSLPRARHGERTLPACTAAPAPVRAHRQAAPGSAPPAPGTASTAPKPRPCCAARTPSSPRRVRWWHRSAGALRRRRRLRLTAHASPGQRPRGGRMHRRAERAHAP